MFGKIICFFVFSAVFVFGQSSATYGNLIRIPFDAVQIDPADTAGNWISYIDTSYAVGFTRYEDIIHTPQSTFFEKFKQDDYNNFGLITNLILEEFTNQTSDSYGNWNGQFDISEPYLILKTYPYKIENGTWLINGLYNMAFLSNNDDITILPRNYYRDLVYICTEINGKYLTVFRKDTQEPSYDFYLADLSNSPDIDTANSGKIFFDTDVAPHKMKHLFDSVYIGVVDSLPGGYPHSLQIYNLEGNTFHYVKSVTTAPDNSEEWEYKDGLLFIYRQHSLERLELNQSDTSFVTILITPIESGFAVNHDFSIFTEIRNDSLFIFDNNIPQLINKIDISELRDPGYPVIDSPYVYLHQTTLVTDVKEENPLRHLSYNLQVYPNPFNPSANLIYTLPERTLVQIKLFDILGRQVKELYSGDADAGKHKLIINGAEMSAGIYFVRFISKNYSDTRKILLLK
jgi:hypothetical protein